MTNRINNASNRFYELDLLRFVAAFAVLVFHYCYQGHNSEPQLSLWQFPNIEGYAFYGKLGVDLFFLLSGFVIALSAAGRSPFQFVLSRCVRLYPVYWTCIAITLLVTIFSQTELYTPTLEQIFVNLTMLQMFVGVENLDSVYWTLAVELKFYFLIFLVLLFNVFDRMLLLLWVFFVLSVADQLFHIPIVSFFLFSKWSPYFIAGCCFFMLTRGSNKWAYQLLILACFIDLLVHRSFLWSTPGLGYEQGPGYLAFLVCGFGLLWLAAEGKLSVLRRPELLQLGMLTYPLYLIHDNVGFILFENMPAVVNKYVALSLVTTASLAMAWGICRWIEPAGGRALKAGLLKVSTWLPPRVVAPTRVSRATY